MSNVEKHYSEVIEIINSLPDEEKKLGLGVAWAYFDDPRHLLFTLARYKFASKILNGKKKVLEVGCGDGFASRLLLQNVESLVGIDIDKLFIDDALERNSESWPIDFRIHDILDDGPIKENFDGVISCDVMEHIDKKNHPRFLKNIYDSMKESSCAVIGMPSIESQVYASPRSKIGHVSCMNQEEMKATLEAVFNQVFIFSMNDEIVHTGYSAMSHYNMALCIKK